MVYGGKYSFSVMADPETNSYDRKISGNVLVLGSTASGKTTHVKVMSSNSMFGKFEVLTGYQLSSFPRKGRLL